jgi:hypothetical protein
VKKNKYRYQRTKDENEFGFLVKNIFRRAQDTREKERKEVSRDTGF